MAGLFSRLKVWTGLEVVKNSDLNAEFDNIINNLGPSTMSGWSATVAQMQIQTSPGVFGMESQASSTSGEIERIRYMLNLIIGGTNSLWYDPPSLSLSQVNTLLAPGGVPVNRIGSGRISATSLQPMHLVPAGVSNTVTLKGSPDFNVFINAQSYTFTSDISLTPLALAPTTNNTFVINDANANLSSITKSFGSFIADLSGTVSNPQKIQIFDEYDIVGTTCGSNITSLQGSYAAFKYSHGGNTEYFIGFVKSATTGAQVLISKAYRGYFFDKDDNPVPPIGLNNSETVTLMGLAWIYIKNDGTLLSSYTNPRYAAVQPATSSAGDMWYDMVVLEWKQSNGSTYTSANCEIVGAAITDSTNCVAARSFDWYRPYRSDSNLTPEWFSTDEFRCKRYMNSINVYSLLKSYEHDALRWTTSDFDSGVTLGASTTYYLYIKDTGASVISDLFPFRRFDLQGYYHPYQSWRCVGIIYSDGSMDFDQYSICMLNYIDGDLIADKSISISKLKSVRSIVCDQNLSTPPIADIDQIAYSTSCSSAGGSGAAQVMTDANGKDITCSLTCTGRPILIGLVVSDITDECFVSVTSNTAGAAAQFYYYMDGVQVVFQAIDINAPTSGGSVSMTNGLGATWSIIPDVIPGVHDFVLYASANAGDSIQFTKVRMFAKEI